MNNLTLPIFLWLMIVIGSCCLSPAPVAGAVLFESFAVPLAPNTHLSGPNSVTGYFYQGKIYKFQWRLAPFAVDLDANGTIDLTFVGTRRIGGTSSMSVSVDGNNRIWATVNSTFNINAVGLKEGSFVGSTINADNPRTIWHGEFANDVKPLIMSGNPSGHLGGDFGRKPFDPRYLGVRFERDGALHFGWLAISGYNEVIGEELFIHAWAYESEPGKGLIAGQIPEPCSSLLLVSGVLLLCTRRFAACSLRRIPV